MALAVSRCLPDRLIDVVPRPRHRFRQGQPLRKPGRHGGGQRAAGAVGVDGIDAAGGEDLLPIVGYQNIGDSFTFHVPALDQHGLGAVAEDQVGGMAHVVDIEDFQPAQHLGFGNIGRQDFASGSSRR